MDVFIATHNSRSEVFRRFAPKLADDLNVPCKTDGDFERLWAVLPELPGFCDKLEPIKLMRWFSANGRHKSECASFWAVKMLLVDQQHGEEIDWEEVAQDNNY